MLFSVFVSLLVSWSAHSAPADPWAAAGFSCKVQTGGHFCLGKIAEYPRDIAIVIPDALWSSAAPAELDFVLHFHGNNTSNAGLVPILDSFQLPARYLESGRTAVLIAPLSLGTAQEPTKDFETSLAPAAHFEPFIRGLSTLFRTTGLGAGDLPRSITITSHSGGYRAVTALLAHGKLGERITEVLLFDSTYGRHAPLVAFAKDPTHRLWAFFTPHLDQATGVFMGLLNHEGIPYTRGKRPANHPAIGNACKIDPPGFLDAFRDSRVALIPIDQSHACSVAAYYTETLKIP